MRRYGAGYGNGGRKGQLLPAPPRGFAYLVDGNGKYLTDQDGSYLLVEI